MVRRRSAFSRASTAAGVRAQTGLSFDAGQPGQMVWGHRLVIHPTTPTILMAATTAGLFRTTDGGQTWALVNAGIIPLDRKSEFWDIRFHPTDPSVVYAASTSKSTGLPIRAGHGRRCGAGLPTYGDLCSYSNCNFYPNFSNRIRLAVTPASPDTLYVLYGSPRGFTIGLYRSDDRGNTFGKRFSVRPLFRKTRTRLSRLISLSQTSSAIKTTISHRSRTTRSDWRFRH